HCLAHDSAADSQLLAQGAFSGKAISCLEARCRDELDNLLSRLLVPRSTSAAHCLVSRWFVSQRHKKRGTGTHTPLGCGRKCRLLSLLIGIAIATRDEHTKAMMNVGDN